MTNTTSEYVPVASAQYSSDYILGSEFIDKMFFQVQHPEIIHEFNSLSNFLGKLETFLGTFLYYVQHNEMSCSSSFSAGPYSICAIYENSYDFHCGYQLSDQFVVKLVESQKFCYLLYHLILQ